MERVGAGGKAKKKAAEKKKNKKSLFHFVSLSTNRKYP
jgi:hypothetical protein